jgi:hypothetical protein
MIHAGPKSKSESGVQQCAEDINQWSTPVKRSKRREGLVDEDSSARAQRLKAIKNLDAPGMSETKSFLSFTNDKIKSSIISLGISGGINLDQGIDKIKNIELHRMLETPVIGLANEAQNTSDDDGESDVDNDFGLDHNAIKHLIGDIAETMDGNDGSPLTNFKPLPRHKKACSSRKPKARNKTRLNRDFYLIL